MGTNVIEIEGLRKEYGRGRRRVAAIDGLDLVVPEGGVFGFLGPNGSGKTTTIRCVLGLVRPTRGAVRLLGQAGAGGLAESMPQGRRDRRVAGAVPDHDRARQPGAARRDRSHRRSAGSMRSSGRSGSSDRGRRRGEEVLARHASAARSRRRRCSRIRRC